MSKKVNQSARRQAHRTFTKRYWKKASEEFSYSIAFGEENINRMKLGSAPRRLALLRHQKTGLLVEMHVPLELHHPFGCKEETPQDEQTLVELWPWNHALCDDNRHFPYDFIEWRSFR